ncbi:MAG TPA: CheR family methyltransferase [Gammaproteobacteria bacterium]|nr:CheR family methyltransferase [Gammaproteobacteria bacterium]
MTSREFGLFRDWLYRSAGISLAEHKRTLVAARLLKRVQQLGAGSYGEYFHLLMNGDSADELQVALDLLTTNETYFFREPKHFDYLREEILPRRSGDRPFRVWSAASSSGEEAYTIAMVLAEVMGLGAPWEILGSDISSRVLAMARSARYGLARATGIPKDYLAKYCLKGIGRQSGSLLIDRPLRERVSFRSINLNAALPEIGTFDVVFLRNVMIYFDLDTKRKVVARILPHLRPGGYLILSHAENLHGVTDAVEPIEPSIFRRPA